MNKGLLFLLSLVLAVTSLSAQTLETLPADPFFDTYQPVKAPVTQELLLKKGDLLAIVGDSITEQKMYSRIMETYLTVCVPQLEISCRQFGWSGETAGGLRGRLVNDCLRFEPDVATTSYGMNDHHYESFKKKYGDEYYDNTMAVVKMFKEAGTSVVLGSPGDIAKKPHWQKKPEYTVEMMSHSLCEFRNIDVKIAQQENVAFADVFVPMLVAGFDAKKMYGEDYAIGGNDGVHPDWAGHLVMAYAFLKGLGLDGNIGTITMDLANGSATASEGHKVLGSSKGQAQLESTRYPFCAAGPANSFKTIRSGMTLVPFNEELNRLTLTVKNCQADRYIVSWGDQQHTYSKEQLAKGVNLAADYDINPFSEAFKKVDEAVAQKQNYETHQIKDMFHSDEARFDMDAVVNLTERLRQQKVDNLKKTIKPVTYSIKVVAE